MQLRYDDPKPLAKREESALWPAQKMGVPLVSTEYRHAEVIAPGASVLAEPIDGFMVTTDGTITVVTGDDPAAAAIVLTVKAGVVYPITCSKVTASSAGAVAGLYHRKASNP